LVDAAMLLRSPGNSALVFFSCNTPNRKAENCQLLALLRESAQMRRIRLLEILLEPNATIKSQVAAGAGFARLTRLEYLKRPAESQTVKRPIDRTLRWVPFSENSQALFAETIRRTYAQSQDCPELTDIRPMEDVLADHRAAGEFDPAFWQLAIRDGDAAGVLLMSRIENQHAFEIVYMGVPPEARGRGLGDALLARATELSTTIPRGNARSSPPALVLAVDERNAHAKGLYSRWGFAFFGARDAWIATSPPTRG
jgi:ribosomal protein S18 acetylase RimI-like enzyme